MARKFVATAYERAIQAKPAPTLQEYRNPDWMAHTPVSHDK